MTNRNSHLRYPRFVRFLAAPALATALGTGVGCGPSVKTEIDGLTGSPKGVIAPIDIYEDERSIPKGTTVVGTIRIGDTGFSTDCGFRTAVAAMKEEARRIGADGVYLARVQEPDWWSTCYRITGRLLRYEPRSTEGANGHTPAEPPAWATWRPTQTEVIRIRSHHRQPSTAPDLFDRTAAGTISLSTKDREGTGFLITRDGLALTNHHVVEGHVEVMARTASGKALEGRVLRRNETADVALLEIDCDNDCFTLDISRSSPRPGQPVWIVGVPIGLEHSVSAGIVSGLRNQDGHRLIQTDAAINPGNSGGPIVDRDTGQVIGIATAKIVAESIEGLGFGVAAEDGLRALGAQLD